MEIVEKEILKENNEYESILEDINRGHKKILKNLNEYLNKDDKNLNNDKTNYNQNRFMMLAILYGTYIGTLGTLGELKDKKITTDDLNFLQKISEKGENNNINEILNIFTETINSLSEFYLKIKDNKKEEKLKDANNTLINLNEKKLEIKLNNNIYVKKNNNLKNNKLNNDKNNINKNIIKKKDEEKPKTSTCIFCIEEFNEDEIVNPILECFNHIHGRCFANYIEHELNNNKFPIKCPLCPKEQIHEINYKTIYDCLILNDKDSLVNKLENMSLNRLSETNPDEVSFCPTPGCSYMCFYDINVFHLDCPLCKKSYCLKCKTEWHENLTCKEYQDEKKYEENMTEEDKLNEKKFNEYVKGNKCKQCPKCKRWVEKNRGCDHITCPCGTHFCYRCGELRDSNDPYKHRCKNNKGINDAYDYYNEFDDYFNLDYLENLNINDNQREIRRDNIFNDLKNQLKNNNTFNLNNNYSNNNFNNMNMNNYYNNSFNNMNMNDYYNSNFNNMNNSFNNMNMNNYKNNNFNNMNMNYFNNMNMNNYYNNNFNMNPNNFNNNILDNQMKFNQNFGNNYNNMTNNYSFNPLLMKNNNYNNKNNLNDLNLYKYSEIFSQQNNNLNNQNQFNLNNIQNNENADNKPKNKIENEDVQKNNIDSENKEKQNEMKDIIINDNNH